MNDGEIQRYADLVVRVGANVQPGQLVGINADLEHAPFVRALVRSAYAAGARHVDVLYGDAYVKREHVALAPEEELGWSPPWRVDRHRAFVAERAAYVNVHGEPDPDLMSTLDPERMRRSPQRELMAAALRISESQAVNWTIVGFPTRGWARKVLGSPDVDRLFELIAQTVRLDEADPVAAWQAHIARLRERARLLNERRFDAVRFRGPGTDLTVGLIPGASWQDAQDLTVDGRVHVANMPTEEVFTTPHRERAEGRVRATYPFALMGAIVSGLELELRDGRIVEVRADSGEELVRAQLALDENASRLGEVSIVDGDSRVGRTGVVFYDTLYDENAACHIAYGSGIYQDLEGVDPTDDEALRAAGVNRSGVHTDFMVGSGEVEVDGLAGSESVPILRGGVWQLS